MVSIFTLHEFFTYQDIKILTFSLFNQIVFCNFILFKAILLPALQIISHWLATKRHFRITPFPGSINRKKVCILSQFKSMFVSSIYIYYIKNNLQCLGFFFSILIANDYPGPSDFSTSGSLIWKNKKVTIKGRNKCYFDEEGNNIYQKLKKKKIWFYICIHKEAGWSTNN